MRPGRPGLPGSRPVYLAQVTDPALRLARRPARVLRARLLAAVLGVLVALPLAAQSDSARRAAMAATGAPAGDKLANRPLNVGALGSQRVMVLPMGAVLVSDGALRDTLAMRRWRQAAIVPAVDTAFGEALALRAPEVSWILPDETRRMVKRAAGLLPPAERLGQVMLLRNGSKVLPDPLRAHLRTLTAMGGGRYTLIPAGLVLRPDAEVGTQAILTLVVGDPRTGEVLFRTNAYGRGATAEAALRAALDATLPPEPTLP